MKIIALLVTNKTAALKSKYNLEYSNNRVQKNLYKATVFPLIESGSHIQTGSQIQAGGLTALFLYKPCLKYKPGSLIEAGV